MKKLIFTLFIFISAVVSSNAQHCSASTSSCQPKPKGPLSGLSPVSDSLPCIIKGENVNTTIYFQNFDSFGTFGKVNTLTIKRIDSLPAGLCWASNTASSTFNGGQTGCINVTGICTAAPGQYKLKITIDANVGPGLGIPIVDADAETLANLRYYVRVIGAQGCICIPNDTTAGKTKFFIPNNSCALSISETASDINSITVVPNPFSSSAQVLFFAENQGDYTARLTNVIGSEVYRKEVAVEAGSNKINLDRGTLNTGVYFFSLSNAKGSVTKRVVVE